MSATHSASFAASVSYVVASLQTGDFALRCNQSQNSRSRDLLRYRPLQQIKNVGDSNVGAPTLHAEVLA